ncbi:MAG: hypothetical protein AB1750_04025 [Chloroflexota bacterium]
MKTRHILSLLFLFLVAACGPKANDPAEPILSGVKGQSLIGPMCPAAQSPCPDQQPYPTTLIVLTTDGREILRFETDAEGKFAVNLPPGDYILHPDRLEGAPLPSAPDVPFTVVENQFTNIIITFDSGIR